MDVSKILLLPSRIKQQLDIKSFMPFNIKCNLNYFTDIENAHISTIKLLLRVPISTRSCYTAVYALHHILKGYTKKMYFRFAWTDFILTYLVEDLIMRDIFCVNHAVHEALIAIVISCVVTTTVSNNGNY